MSKVNCIYKIKRLSDKKYSTGGMCPSFSRNGKAWSCIGNLKSHLAMIRDYGNEKKYNGCVIEVFYCLNTIDMPMSECI